MVLFPVPVSLWIVPHAWPQERRDATLQASTATLDLPICLPYALASLMPERVCSAIRLPSNSATAPRTVNTILPVGVAVSTCSERERSRPLGLEHLQRAEQVSH